MNHSIFKSQSTGLPLVRVNLNTHKLTYKQIESIVTASDEVSSNAPCGNCSAGAAVLKNGPHLKMLHISLL